jgi:hypothetical protein
MPAAERDSTRARFSGHVPPPPAAPCPATPGGVQARAAASTLIRQKTLPAHDDSGMPARQHRCHGDDIPPTAQVSTRPGQRDQRSFLLQRAQPAIAGLIDGSLSTLAPVFAVAFATHQPRYAFLAGLATAIGAGVSMAFSEGLSDTGEPTGRGHPYARGAITGAGTFLGGILHTLPFLILQYRPAVLLALAAIAFELLALAWIRRRFFGISFFGSLITVTLGGAIIATISAALGAVN